jgi:putative (di)nucleoside polyphosphate hydrolase
VIDTEGYRANVGIVLCNAIGELFWARRIGEDAWQFPQGGIREHETAEQALFRELNEEIGLQDADVKVLGSTRDWLRYRLPEGLIRTESKPLCIGQKQRWFLLELTGPESNVCLDTGSRPEFDMWRWVEHQQPVQEVVAFKRDVYQQALDELLPLLTRRKTG